jgi:hypothetical protein
MPSIQAVRSHWGITHPECIRCGSETRVEKAHIIDRCAGGLDHAGNLLPLCHVCHREQPEFVNGDEAEALAWFGAEKTDDRWVFHADADHVLRRAPFGLIADTVMVSVRDALKVLVDAATELERRPA